MVKSSYQDVCVLMTLEKGDLHCKVEIFQTLFKDGSMGLGLRAVKSIRRHGVIAYYRMRVSHIDKTEPNPYLMSLHTFAGYVSKFFVGDVCEVSPAPRRGIPFVGHLANEACNRASINAEYDSNHQGVYLTPKRKILRAGDIIDYKLVASRDIAIGEEVLVDYGPRYNRHYSSDLYSCSTN